MADTQSKKSKKRPNILVLCEDQWQTHMELPDEVPLPALRRLEAQGVSFNRHYCTVPMCTPARTTMWTGRHAINANMWDNTNYAWLDDMSPDIATVGHMLREQGYYTAYKGKWHLSSPPRAETALEPYGFSDYQQWGEMFGAPLQGAQLDPAAAFETTDWLESRATRLDQPWFLVCSLVNPHDVMFMVPDESVHAQPAGMPYGMQSTIQTLGWFQKEWDITLPPNFEDDYKNHPAGVQRFKEYLDINFGRIPDDRHDLWLKQRNYLVNCMRLVDIEFQKVLDALDRLGLWEDTIVIYTGDHGEMNGAHRMTQKGGIAFDEAVVVPFITCVPGGAQGKRTDAIGSHIDLVPTILDFAGVSEADMRARYPQLKGRSLKSAILNPESAGPRGSVNEPGDGALFMWDALHALDNEWATTGALPMNTDLGFGPVKTPEEWRQTIKETGEKHGAPDFKKRTFFRSIVDGQYKLVRWFSPSEYGNPSTLEELYAMGDVGLYDLVNDPGELDNLGDKRHPKYDPALVEGMLKKLHKLVHEEIGDEKVPFDLGMFGTRQVTYHNGS